MSTPSPGDVLSGKFRIERVLGEGGMGVVLAAHHLHLGRTVAIKLLQPEALKHQEIVARFANEARSASRIQSEHVARVLDVGTLDTGEPYMVMEYLEGSDLSKLVKRQGPLAIEDAVEYLLQACEALAEAHVAGIVHRDLKPANLYLTRRADGSACVKVLDFGISKAALVGTSPEAQQMTQTQSVLGTPGYMAPEQLRSAKHVDPRTDIWALGVILQELLTGKLAFQGSTVPEVYLAILQNPPDPLRTLRPDAPPALEAVILRCLEKDAARRFASVGELAAALVPFAPQRARLSAERIGRITGVVVPPAGAAAPRAGISVAPPGPAVTQGGVAPTIAGTGYATGPTLGPAHSGYGVQGPTPPGYGPQGATPPGYHAQPPPGYGPQGPTPPGYHPQPQGYGPQGAMPQQPYGTAYGARPMQPMAPADPNKGKMHPSTVALIAILGLIMVTFGGCLTCVCAAGASAPASNEKTGQAR
ncbi:serine/threonine-protein kinase [Polyangium sp. y55x31]|uniref:serine/threonine-protein kinase n=1 Tax=Polyangium sp. y55x31 TaxID=3042688 RepID=UPI0024830708|nr:serine/threonine-protein kinase [Polyangium sp. y55x31]MDI1481433.1 serine/threonine-protein kinase [Polyangium sp. y55x31]